jgi:serine/threonine-protein kinase
MAGSKSQTGSGKSPPENETTNDDGSIDPPTRLLAGRTGFEPAPVEAARPRGVMTATTNEAALETEFQPGMWIGRYELLAPLAAGGMAQVWAAKPEGPGFSRTVAIKLVHPEFADHPEYVKMFIDEASVAASIHHSNVCELYELGRHDDILFMAIEWVAGDSLAGILRQGDSLKPIKYAVAARIIADACAGLHAAHEALGPDGQPLGIVHRDISPPNILISLHGQVKVSDFGIAKAQYQVHSATKTGEVKGKFAYIPPEQIAGRHVDRRADVYSMGCTLYVATLGLRPFGSGPQALAKIMEGNYRKPREVDPDYPLALENIVLKALANDREQRFQSADEMRTELEEAILFMGRAVSHADVARLVNERINPEKKANLEGLLKTNRVLPGLMAFQLLAPEETSTPTASSGINVRPKALRPRADSRPDGSLPQARARAESRPDGALPQARPRAESKPDGSVQRANSAGRAAQRSVSDDDDETSILSSPPDASSSPPPLPARSIELPKRAPSSTELAPIETSRSALRDNWLWILIALAGLAALVAALLTRS